MKRKLTTFIALLVASAATFHVQAQDPASSVAGVAFTEETTYVMYNVGSSDFLGASNNYAARASLVGSTAQQVKFVEVTEGKYRIENVGGVAIRNRATNRDD